MVKNIPSSMRHLLDLFAGQLYGRLIPASSLQRVLALAGTLPPLSGAGLEYHLGTPVPRTDFLIRATGPDFGRAAFAGRHRVFKIDRTLLAGEHWAKITAFFRAWSNPASLLFKHVENVWLEFDILPQGPLFPGPSIFFDLDRENRSSLKEKVAVIDLALAELGHRLSTVILDKIRECLDLSAQHFQLYYVGVMLARHTETVRICLRGQEKTKILACLHATGWRGNAPAVAALLSTFVNDGAEMILDLDIGTHVQAGIGLEILGSTWGDFFDLLTEHNLCSPGDAEEILAWPGYGKMPAGHLQKSVSIAMNKEVRRLIKRLNHVKLTCDSAGNVNAKAYLYFGYY